MEIDKERIQSLIKYRALGKELEKLGYPINLSNFYPDRLTKPQQKIVDLLEVKIQEFLNELDKLRIT